MKLVGSLSPGIIFVCKKVKLNRESHLSTIHSAKGQERPDMVDSRRRQLISSCVVSRPVVLALSKMPFLADGSAACLRWSCRAFWSSMMMGDIRISCVSGDRAVRSRSSNAYNVRSRLRGRRRIPVAMGRTGVGRAAGDNCRVVQAPCPGHLGRHAVLRGICAAHARGRKADRSGRTRSGLPGIPGRDICVRRRSRDSGARAAGGVGHPDFLRLQQPPRR